MKLGLEKRETKRFTKFNFDQIVCDFEAILFEELLFLVGVDIYCGCRHFEIKTADEVVSYYLLFLRLLDNDINKNIKQQSAT